MLSIIADFIGLFSTFNTSGVQHDNLIQTISINRVTIESSCGSLREGKDSTGKAGRPQNFFFLTERQFVLIGVFTSNTEKAKKFKVRVVNAFFEMRDALQKQAISPFNNYTLQRIYLHHSNLEKPLPYGYFACFYKMIDVLQKIDTRLGYKLGEQWYDKTDSKNRFLEPDISIGRHFSALFTRDYEKCYQDFNVRYTERENNSRVKNIWDKKQVELQWKLDRATVERELRQKHLGNSLPLNESEINRKEYKFQPSPESGRTDDLPPAYCYSDKYTSLFSDWLREVFFKFCWRDYILERDADGWMKRYKKFKLLTPSEQVAFLTTTEGGMISGFEFRETWEKQIPSGD